MYNFYWIANIINNIQHIANYSKEQNEWHQVIYFNKELTFNYKQALQKLQQAFKLIVILKLQDCTSTAHFCCQLWTNDITTLKIRNAWLSSLPQGTRQRVEKWCWIFQQLHRLFEGEWKTADRSFCTLVVSHCVYLGGRTRHPQLATPHPELVGSAVPSAAAQRATRARQTPWPRGALPDRAHSHYWYWILPGHTVTSPTRRAVKAEKVLQTAFVITSRLAALQRIQRAVMHNGCASLHARRGGSLRWPTST